MARTPVMNDPVDDAAPDDIGSDYESQSKMSMEPPAPEPVDVEGKINSVTIQVADNGGFLMELFPAEGQGVTTRHVYQSVDELCASLQEQFGEGPAEPMAPMGPPGPTGSRPMPPRPAGRERVVI